jgi:hypothetical protein
MQRRRTNLPVKPPFYPAASERANVERGAAAHFCIDGRRTLGLCLARPEAIKMAITSRSSSCCKSA